MSEGHYCRVAQRSPLTLGVLPRPLDLTPFGIDDASTGGDRVRFLRLGVVLDVGILNIVDLDFAEARQL